MDNKRKGLHDLLKARGLGPKNASGSRPLLTFPPPPPPPPTVGLLPMPNLKKKKKEKEIVKEGEVVLEKEPKQQKIVKDKGWASSMESREAEHSADMSHLTWNSRLELDGASVHWNSSIREFHRGHSYHVAEALKRQLLLSKDMDALKHMRQPELFLSLKRDLALVSSLAYFTKSGFLSSFFLFFFFFLTYPFIAYVQAIHKVFVAKEWVKDAQNGVKVEANLCAEADRALGDAKQKNQELTTKLAAEGSAQRSAEAGLQNA